MNEVVKIKASAGGGKGFRVAYNDAEVREGDIADSPLKREHRIGGHRWMLEVSILQLYCGILTLNLSFKT